MLSDDSKNKYKEKIRKMSEELAEAIILNETDLEKRYRSLDSDVHDILIDIGNSTMQIIGKSTEDSVKKKPRKKG